MTQTDIKFVNYQDYLRLHVTWSLIKDTTAVSLVRGYTAIIINCEADMYMQLTYSAWYYGKLSVCILEQTVSHQVATGIQQRTIDDDLSLFTVLIDECIEQRANFNYWSRNQF